jgi:uncharacterized protein (TIGR03086 family)
MSDVSERYDKCAEQFESKTAGVPAVAWDNPSPNPGWSVRDVVRHIVDSSELFLSWIDVSVEDKPDVDVDPLAAWKATRGTVQRCLEDPQLAQEVIERSLGTGPWETFVDRYLCIDLVVHAWDLARGAAIDDTLDQDLVGDIRTEVDDMVEIGRKMGAFGPEVHLDGPANEQDRLLALLGRQP